MNQSDMTVYHGSEYIIREPRFGAGSRYNDYGSGFYMTQSHDLACEWACARGTNGFANEYRLKTDGLSILRLTEQPYHILNWLAVLLENRTFRITSDIMRDGKTYILDHFLPEYQKFDLIIGYRADDSYFSFANSFLNNGISLEQLSEAMRLGRLGEQIVLKSRDAFECIRFIDADPADRGIFYPLSTDRDRRARDRFRQIRTEGAASRIYLIDLLREKWEDDDLRLRELSREV